MPSIPQRLYNQVMMADDFTCVYCGKRSLDMQIDHFIPRSLGGPDVFQNIYACCPECNTRKGNRPIHIVRMQASYGRFQKVKTPAQTRKRTEKSSQHDLRGLKGWEMLGMSPEEFIALKRMVRVALQGTLEEAAVIASAQDIVPVPALKELYDRYINLDTPIPEPEYPALEAQRRPSVVEV